jgi:hypothetical protein
MIFKALFLAMQNPVWFKAHFEPALIRLFSISRYNATILSCFFSKPHTGENLR